MKKILLGALSIAFGIAAAIAVHCSFMIVEIEGSDMLPTFEPEQKVIVFLLAGREDVKEGDLIAYKPHFYQIDGSRGPIVRRVKNISGSELELACDAELTSEDEIFISDEDILGKVMTVN